jgi:hypothetical protein
LLLSTGLATVLIAATTALATPATGVTFFLTQRDDFDPIAWQVHGAIEDAGTWDRGVITFSGGKSPGFAGMIQTFETNNTKTGTFRMNFEGRGTNDPFSFSGTWTISQGTGIYKGLHGTGTWYEVDIPDPDNPGHLLFTFPCAGSVHFD